MRGLSTRWSSRHVFLDTPLAPLLSQLVFLKNANLWEQIPMPGWDSREMVWNWGGLKEYIRYTHYLSLEIHGDIPIFTFKSFICRKNIAPSIRVQCNNFLSEKGQTTQDLFW